MIIRVDEIQKAKMSRRHMGQKKGEDLYLDIADTLAMLSIN